MAFFIALGHCRLPKTLKNGANMGSKINRKLKVAWRRHKTPLEAHLGQILGPCWTKLGPKLDQVGAKLSQDGTKLDQVDAKLGQDGAKMGQVGAK